MKRFLAFKGDVCYPSRGMGDFYGDYDTKDEAIEALKVSHEHAHLWEYWNDDLAYGVVWDSLDRRDVWDHYEMEDQS